MQLLPEERRRLDLIEGMLRAEAPGLAAKFDIFTRLARGEGRPPAEKQFRTEGAWRSVAFAGHRAWWCFYLILGILGLVMAALILVLILELT